MVSSQALEDAFLLQEAQEPSGVEIHPQVATVEVVIAEASCLLHLHLALDLPLLDRLFLHHEIAHLVSRHRSRSWCRPQPPLVGRRLYLLFYRCGVVGRAADGAGSRLAGELLHEVPEVGDVGLDDLRRDDVDDLYLGPHLRWRRHRSPVRRRPHGRR